jgi:thymidine kinase
MSLELIIGPMFSGKSTMLLSYEKKFQMSKKNYICINHSFDTRYSSEGKISTHDGKMSSGKHVSTNKLSHINSVELIEYDAFIIDEVQFFDDVDSFVDFWTSKGKYIICAGLNSDYKKLPFNNISKIISRADKIHHLTALCSDCGKEAPFTQRCVKDERQTLVGSTDMYLPKCRTCHKVIV